MDKYIEMLDTYLAQTGPEINCAKVNSLLEMLFCCYHQSNGLDTDQIRTHFNTLSQLLDKLSLEENDRVFDVACQLCNEHQAQAFQEGVTVGFRLYNELHTRKN